MNINETHRATVLWYNQRKGYGFIKTGEEEVFIHKNTLGFFGLSRLDAGDELVVTLTQNAHGHLVGSILSVTRPEAPTPATTDRLDDLEIFGKVKFFNPERGFGFIEIVDGNSDVSEDVFLHVKTLREAGLNAIDDGQELALVLTSENQKPGQYAAKSVRLFVRHPS